MRITDPNNLANAVPAETTPAQPGVHPNTDAQSGSIGVGSDRADLSGVAGRLSEMLQAEPASRAQRIQQLKEAVASGAYQVDSAAVSRALVDEALTPSGKEPIKL